VIDSFSGEQNNVVFMGRRSFRMKMAATSGDAGLAIPMSASEIPTQKIFEADRERGDRAAGTSHAARGISSRTLVALCLTTFSFGVALTLTFIRWTEPRSIAVAAAAPAPVAAAPVAPAPAVLIQPLPVAPPTDAELMAVLALQPHARRAPARPARVVRPRAVATPDVSPVVKPWVDPFAE
jgi:hypothetical protein